MRRYLLQNVALPFAVVTALVSFGFFLEYLHGEGLGQFINFFLGVNAFLLLMMAALFVLLVKKRFLFALSAMACLVFVVLLVRTSGRLPYFYLMGLRNGIQRRMDVGKLREWTFAQPVPDHGFQVIRDRDIPEELRSGFPYSHDLLITVKSTSEGGRELLVGSIGISFDGTPSLVRPYMDLGNHASVFVDMRQ